MLCTSCSKPVRPIVAVDVDGTLGDYHGHFLSFAIDWTGRGMDWLDNDWDSYDGSYPFSEYVCDQFGIDLATYRQIKLAYRQGGMKRTMPILTGAQALCWSIKDRGADLWITTTRPYLSLDNIVPDTVEWLRRHEIAYDGMLFDEDKYSQLANRVDPRRVVAVFDDLPEMYDAVIEALPHTAPYLVMGQYNGRVRRALTCDLDSAADLALASIDAWKVEHGC